MFSDAGIEYGIISQLQPTVVLLLQLASYPKKVLYQDNEAAEEMLCGLKSTSPPWHAIWWLQGLQQSSGCNCCRQFVGGGKRGAHVAEQARAVGRFELATSWELCKFL